MLRPPTAANRHPVVTPSQRHRLALLLLWVTPVIWSSNYVIARAAKGVVLPHVLALGRWSLALLILLPWVGRELWQRRDQVRAEWRQSLALGAAGMWICGAIVYLGGQSTTATNIGLIYAAAPVGIAIASRQLMHEHASGWQRLGMGLALLGVVFVVIKGDWHNLLAVRFTPGDGWILLCMLSWVAYSVLQQHWRSALPAQPRLACIMVGGVVVLLPFTLLEAWLVPPLPLTAHALTLIVAAAILPGLLSYVAYAFLIRELGATRSSLLLYLGPVYGSLNAWWLLGEVPQWYHLAGATLILPSIWLASRRG